MCPEGSKSCVPPYSAISHDDCRGTIFYFYFYFTHDLKDGLVGKLRRLVEALIIFPSLSLEYLRRPLSFGLTGSIATLRMTVCTVLYR